MSKKENNKNLPHNPVPRAYLGGVYVPKGVVFDDIKGFLDAANWWNSMVLCLNHRIEDTKEAIDAGRGDDAAALDDIDAMQSSRKESLKAIAEIAGRIAVIAKRASGEDDNAKG